MIVDHQQLVDAALFHQFGRLGGEPVCRDRARIAAHRHRHGRVAQIAHMIECPTQIAIGEDTLDRTSGIEHDGHAHAATGDLHQRFSHAGLRAYRRNGVRCSHHIRDMGEQPPTQGSARMGTGEIGFTESPCLQQRHGERIAQRQRASGARGRRQIQRTGFFVDARIQVCIGFARQRGARVTSHGDHASALALDQRQDGKQLNGLSGIGQRQQNVVPGNHAQVTVIRFGRVHEVGRRAGAGHSGGDLAADMTGFAQAAHYHATPGFHDQCHGTREMPIQTTAHAAQGIDLYIKDAAGRSEQTVGRRNAKGGWHAERVGGKRYRALIGGRKPSIGYDELDYNNDARRCPAHAAARLSSLYMSSTLHLVLLLLAASVAVVAVFRAMGLPPILAYLLVGAVSGPHALAAIPDTNEARHLAEFGIVFLMFSIGLEFSLPKLFSMKRLVFGLGATQVLVTAAGIAFFAWLFGLSADGAVALGGAVAMSSTAVLSKLLVERMELDSKHGREVIGVLLFQDLAVVPLLVVIPALALGAHESMEVLLAAAVKAAVALTIILYLGPRVMQRWFFFVAMRKSPELFMLNVLLVTLGLAFITDMAGLSLALGAFLAGMLISETEYRYQVEDDIKPFRDVLLGLFFVTVGMRLDLATIASEFVFVLVTLLLLLFGKFAVAATASRLFGASQGNALRVGLWLCAGGEFGFVLLSLMDQADLLPPRILQIVLSALLLSLLAAPLIAHYADKLVLRLVPSEWLLRSMQLTSIAAQSLATEGHAIVCGYGRNGQYLGRFLEHEGLSYIALDLDPERVREAAAAGETVVFGDAGKRETLIAAGISRASVVVVTFVNTDAALRVIHLANELRPDVPVVVRTFDERDYDKLAAAGATEVVPESLESSIMLASHALVLLGIPINRVLKRIRQLRGERYHLLRGLYRGAEHLNEEAIADSHQMRLHSVVLAPGAYAIGHSIGEFRFENIRVEVSAIRRRGIRALEPSADMAFLAGDVVVLLGEPAELARAEARLLKG